MTVWCSGFLLAAWLLLELVLRKGGEARSWEADRRDRSSTRLIVLTYLAAAVAPIFFVSSAGSIAADSVTAWIGIAAGAFGLVIRIASMRALGRDYTRSLRTRSEQTIVDRGPYRVIRHPGYLGSILIWVGGRLAVNWLVAFATAVVLAIVYRYRITAEEHMLDEHFGALYSSYKRHTWRLVPYVW
jgi:protein-S-isoprenylcysteine O-methyltransferase Ste14